MRGRSNPQIAIWLTTAVGIISLVTGIVYIGSPTVMAPLEPYLPGGVRAIAGFTGTLTGFLLLASSTGLRYGLRIAWYVTLALLPAAAFQAVIQSSPVSIPLIVLSLVAVPIVYAHRSSFDRKTKLDESQLAAAAALFGVLAYGATGTFAIRDQYREVETLLDAFYYTVVTATTVGYGDAVPETQVAKLFTLSVVLFGASSFVLAGGVLLGPLLEGRFKRALGKMTTTELERLNNHVIVLGYGDLTESILSDLQDHVDVLVVTANVEVASLLRDRGIAVLVENPTDEGTLEQAQISRARTVMAATNNDGDDALAVLTTRRVDPDVFLVAAATNKQNLDKLRDAGADVVISPTAIGSEMLAKSAIDQADPDGIGLS